MKQEVLQKMQEQSKLRYWKGGKVIRMPKKRRKFKKRKNVPIKKEAEIKPLIDFQKVAKFARLR